jgi:hypothetical protein
VNGGREGLPREHVRWPSRSETTIRKNGTDARVSLESRYRDGLAPRFRVSLDQESPGSSPGGAMKAPHRIIRSRRFPICGPEAVSEKRIGLGIPCRRGLMIL